MRMLQTYRYKIGDTVMCTEDSQMYVITAIPLDGKFYSATHIESGQINCSVSEDDTYLVRPPEHVKNVELETVADVIYHLMLTGKFEMTANNGNVLMSPICDGGFQYE